MKVKIVIQHFKNPGLGLTSLAPDLFMVSGLLFSCCCFSLMQQTNPNPSHLSISGVCIRCNPICALVSSCWYLVKRSSFFSFFLFIFFYSIVSYCVLTTQLCVSHFFPGDFIISLAVTWAESQLPTPDTWIHTRENNSKEGEETMR